MPLLLQDDGDPTSEEHRPDSCHGWHGCGDGRNDREYDARRREPRHFAHGGPATHKRRIFAFEKMGTLEMIDCHDDDVRITPKVRSDFLGGRLTIEPLPNCSGRLVQTMSSLSVAVVDHCLGTDIMNEEVVRSCLGPIIISLKLSVFPSRRVL